MDTQSLAILIIGIILIGSIILFAYVFGNIINEFVEYFLYKKNSEKFYKLLIKLLHQEIVEKDIIDLYKTIFKISEDEPKFISKITISLEDFKTWILDKEELLNLENPVSHYRSKINTIIEQINIGHPFAELNPENKDFFEDFKKFIDNKEFEASKAKLIDLSKIFSKQNKDIERMERKTTYAYYLTIISVVIGVCSFILPLIYNN